MNIKCRDDVVKSIEQSIKSSDTAVTHLESLCRNVPNELSIQEKREYSNKIYDDIEQFDRFRQNATILLNEAKALPQTEILTFVQSAEAIVPKKIKSDSSTYSNDFAYTTIDKIMFCGKEYKVKNWADALTVITELVVKDKNVTPVMLTNSKNLKGKKRDYFSNDYKKLKRAYELSNGCFLELNFSATDIYKITHLIVSEFGYSEEDFEIHFSKKKGYSHENDLDIDNADTDELNADELSEEAYDDPIKMLKEIEKNL